MRDKQYEKVSEHEWKCKVCGKTSRTMGGIAGHLQVHSEAPKLKCTMCSRKFVRPNCYLKHLKRAHKVVDPKLPRNYLKETVGGKTEETLVEHETGQLPEGTPWLEPPVAEPVVPKAMICDMEAGIQVLEDVFGEMMSEPKMAIEDVTMRHVCVKCSAHHDFDFPNMKHCSLCGGDLKKITYKHIRLV